MGQRRQERRKATLDALGAALAFAYEVNVRPDEPGGYYYAASLGSRIDHPERAKYSRRGDRLWLLGCVLLFLTPSLILFTVRLLAVASVWFALWLVYVLFVIRYFPRVQTAQEQIHAGQVPSDRDVGVP